jgi:outer membrane protein insertion porin family
VGTAVGDDDFQKALHTLADTGAFSDLKYSFSYSSAGTKLDLQVTDARKFLPARFEDFVWFSEAELQTKIHERVPLFQGQLPISGRMPDLVSDVLQALLVENNVPGHVEYLRTSDKNGDTIAFTYSVSGITVRIRKVELSGAGDTESALQLAAEKVEDREYSRDRLSSFIDHELLPILHERGYLQAVFSAPHLTVVKPAHPSDSTHYEAYVDVMLTAAPGSRYKLSVIDFFGNKEVPTPTLLAMLHAKPGEVANSVQLQDDLKQVQSLYGSRGYITCSIKADAKFDDAAKTVAYEVQVTEGDIYHMGDLEFRGLDNSLTAKLRNAWKLRPGDVFDSSYLKEYLPKARALLPANLDWEVSPHVTANLHDKSVDVDLVYSAKALQ